MNGVCWGLSTGEGVGSQEDQLCMALVSQLNKFADKETLIQFLRCFLLESNSSAVRWQAHCLALHISGTVIHKSTGTVIHCLALHIYRYCYIQIYRYCNTLSGPAHLVHTSTFLHTMDLHIYR